MAVTELAFTQDGDKWVAEYTSTGETVVQVERAEKGAMVLYMYIDGMTPASVYPSWGRYDNENLILTVDAMAGVTVRIVSYTEVTAAKTITA